MSATFDSQQAFHRGTSAIFAILTPDQVRRLAELQTEPELSERLTELAGLANEDRLSVQQRAEYEAYLEANNLLAVLQAEARYRLSAPLE